MTVSANYLVTSLLRSFESAPMRRDPYPHWFPKNCLPQSVIDEMLALPFAAAPLDGISGRRELHNNSRHYFDPPNRMRYQCASAVAMALQDARVTSAIERIFGARLGGTYLRIELAKDADGFWLEPHTDIGVKAFTFLLYLSRDGSHADLGTDVYDAEKKWVGRSPFSSGSGMIFVPSDVTYHGFEPRKIEGVRTSLVINYVTNDWRAREQLAYPGLPIAALESAN
jgi:hypothetical protein